MCGIIIIGITTLLKKIKLSKYKINIICGIFLILFMFLTGFTPSVVRACIMAGLGIIAEIVHRKNNVLNSMCLALFITLIYNPYNIRNISVLLSYGGVIGIVFFLKPVTSFINKFIKNKGKIIDYVKNTIAVSFSVQIVIIPIMIYYYKTISFTFFISAILSRIYNKCNYNIRIYPCNNIFIFL